ncbi:CopD family protein [Massilia sp. PAMC28688]|uniref:CopD family protein n=1 Tax=Massilia sp. PAMC28688 TaxID=2861283 RepID=UPI001C627605|nr:CopD family protein [Massilia sp. PAMC28688]QYF94636.1 CopD family protein [Massilia sp. PAMC28688]
MSLMLSLHIAFLVLWSGTLLYFPYLLAQQASAHDDEDHQRLLKMQHTLYAYVMTPAGLLTIIFGSWMLFERGFTGGWLPVKLALVLAMVFFHVYCGTLMEQLKGKEPTQSIWFYRMLLVPPMLLIPAVVALVVQKPF